MAKKKIVKRMIKETDRAIAHVKLLEKLYLESLKTRRK